MDNIIDFKWCEAHGFESPFANTARDSSMCLVKDGYYVVVYTERTTGEKELFVQNRDLKKKMTFEMPKYDFKNNVKNDFTVDDLKLMCDLINLDYPIK